MLPRHKKTLSDMKSAEKKLNDARIKYTKTKQALAKAQKGVVDAKARLAAAQDLWESCTNRETLSVPEMPYAI